MTRSLGCARCGDCCENIAMTKNPADMAATISTSGGVGVGRNASGRVARGPIAGRYARDAAFITKNMRPTGEVRRENGLVKQLLSCAAFDPVERICTAHNERPRMCSEYPWYNGDPDARAIREPHCSYLLDVAPADRPEGSRPFIPLEVL